MANVTKQAQLTRQQLKQAVDLLKTAIGEKAPSWMIEGQMQTVRTLLAAAECISEKAVPQLISHVLEIEVSEVKEDFAAYQAVADFILRKEWVNARKEVRPAGYEGPGWLNR